MSADGTSSPPRHEGLTRLVRLPQTHLPMLVVSALLLTACTTGGEPNQAAEKSQQESPKPANPTRSPTRVIPTTADPVIREVPRSQWKRIVATGVWRPGCPVRRKDLRRVEINHWDFSGEVQRGVLVVNADTAASAARIFTGLFDANFPIRRMRPLEVYDGDSTASLADDNTGAYNCRRPDQINAPVKSSPHANGRAIDINPRENPWKDLRCDCWAPGPENRKRTQGPGKILKGGVAWQLFIDEGWVWQNIDVPDYMHFDTGYPSAPLREPTR